MVDATTGKCEEYYKLQIKFDTDLQEQVRKANRSENLKRKMLCRIRLTHSELSSVLNEVRTVPCTMTKRYKKSFKRMGEGLSGLEYPASVCETWGVGDWRFFSIPKRFDLCFTLSIDCYDDKQSAEKALLIDKHDSKVCNGLSVSEDVVLNVLVQSDHYVCIDVRIIAYMDADGVRLTGQEEGVGQDTHIVPLMH